MRRSAAAALGLAVAVATGCQRQTASESLLFVQTAESGSLVPLDETGRNFDLRLEGVAPRVVYFTDRPVRSAGSMTTEQFLEAWSHGADDFAEDPPNAAVTVGGSGKVAVFELKDPVRDGSSMRYRARVLGHSPRFASADIASGAEVPAELGAVVLFIDNLSEPIDPMNQPDNFGLAGEPAKTTIHVWQ